MRALRYSYLKSRCLNALIDGRFAMVMHDVLSTNNFTLVGMYPIEANNCLWYIKHLLAVVAAMYSASAVLIAGESCLLEVYVIMLLFNFSTYPVTDLRIGRILPQLASENMWR